MYEFFKNSSYAIVFGLGLAYFGVELSWQSFIYIAIVVKLVHWRSA